MVKPCQLTPRNPDKVLVLDLIEKGDSVRSYSDAFIRTSANIGNKFTLFNPKSAQEARELIRQLSPEIVVIDLEMPRAPGTDAVRQIVMANPDARVVVITVSADEADVLEALAAGACGYLLKDARADELVGGIRLAAGGHTVLSDDVARAGRRLLTPPLQEIHR